MKCFKKNREIPINVVCTPAMSEKHGGKIDCFLPSHIKYSIEWMSNGKTALLNLSDDRLHAYNVKPGTYEIIVKQLNSERESRVFAAVDLIDFVAITGYTIEHATTDTSYDGRVVADYTSHSNQDLNFLWTNGTITNSNSLYNIRPGYYTACPVSKLGETIKFIHLVPPAQVRTKR